MTYPTNLPTGGALSTVIGLQLSDGSCQPVSAAQPLPIALISDDTPVPVNLVLGSGECFQIGGTDGGLGGDQDHAIGYGATFSSKGERISIYCKHFNNGDRPLPFNYANGGGKFWLEHDLSGTGQLPLTPVSGSVIPFSSIERPNPSITDDFVLTFQVRAFGLYRLACDVGALGGTTGVIGWNTWVLR